MTTPTHVVAISSSLLIDMVAGSSSTDPEAAFVANERSKPCTEQGCMLTAFSDAGTDTRDERAIEVYCAIPSDHAAVHASDVQ